MFLSPSPLTFDPPRHRYFWIDAFYLRFFSLFPTLFAVPLSSCSCAVPLQMSPTATAATVIDDSGDPPPPGAGTQAGASALLAMAAPECLPTIFVVGLASIVNFRDAAGYSALVTTVEPGGHAFGSLDRSISAAGGSDLNSRRYSAISMIGIGETLAVDGGPFGDLPPVSHIIYTVPPKIGLNFTPSTCQLLAKCYRDVLLAAHEQRITSVALPLLSSGSSRGNAPLADVARAALDAFAGLNDLAIQRVYLLTNSPDVLAAILHQAARLCWVTRPHLPNGVHDFFLERSGKQLVPPPSPPPQDTAHHDFRPSPATFTALPPPEAVVQRQPSPIAPIPYTQLQATIEKNYAVMQDKRRERGLPLATQPPPSVKKKAKVAASNLLLHNPYSNPRNNSTPSDKLRSTVVGVVTLGNVAGTPNAHVAPPAFVAPVMTARKFVNVNPHLEIHAGTYKFCHSTQKFVKHTKVLEWIMGHQAKKDYKGNTVHKNIDCSPDSFRPLSNYLSVGFAHTPQISIETLFIAEEIGATGFLRKVIDRWVAHIGTHNLRFDTMDNANRHFNHKYNTIKGAVHAGLFRYIHTPNPHALREHAILRLCAPSDTTRPASHAVSLPTERGDAPFQFVKSPACAFIDLHRLGFTLLLLHKDAPASMDATFCRKFHPIFDHHANQIITDKDRSVPYNHPNIEVAIFNASDGVVQMNQSTELDAEPGAIFTSSDVSFDSAAKTMLNHTPFHSKKNFGTRITLFDLGFSHMNHVHSKFLSDYVGKTIRQDTDVVINLEVYSKAPLPVFKTDETPASLG